MPVPKPSKVPKQHTPTEEPASSDAGFHPERLTADQLTKDDFGELVVLVEAIRQPLRDNCPGSHVARKAVDFAFAEDIEYTPWHVEKFHAAWREWCVLSDAEKRRVLNGWTPDAKPMTRAGLLGLLSEITADVVSGVEINAHSIVTCEFASWFSEGTEPVRVLIRRGATKAEAVRELMRIVSHVDEEWASLITDPLEVSFPANRRSAKPQGGK